MIKVNNYSQLFPVIMSQHDSSSFYDPHSTRHSLTTRETQTGATPQYRHTSYQHPLPSTTTSSPPTTATRTNYATFHDYGRGSYVSFLRTNQLTCLDQHLVLPLCQGGKGHPLRLDHLKGIERVHHSLTTPLTPPPPPPVIELTPLSTHMEIIPHQFILIINHFRGQNLIILLPLLLLLLLPPPPILLLQHFVLNKRNRSIPISNNSNSNHNTKDEIHLDPSPVLPSPAHQTPHQFLFDPQQVRT